MGSIFSYLVSKFSVTKPLRILMLGLDGAGKTTILYRSKLGAVTRTIPTVGFNVETVEFANSKFTVWDVGGQDKLRRLWRHYFTYTQGVIFVVDSSDRDRIEEAGSELKKLTYEPELQQAVILVLANKQDLPEAMTLTEISDKLRLGDIRNRKCYILGVCAIKGTGLTDAFQKLCEEIME